MKCRPGCSACCGEQLTVCDVEAALLREGTAALDADALARLRARLDALGAGSRTALASGSPCVFLEEDGRCAVYASRPLVCRTQGLPLRYPEGLIPPDAILSRARGTNDPLTWCPLNFTERGPGPEDVLDAERVDTMLALSNRGAGGDPERRTALLDLAREAVSSR